MTTRQLDAKSAEIVLENDVQGVVALVARVEGEDADLVQISTEEYAEKLQGKRKGPPAKADLTVGLPRLVGKFQQRIEHDLSKNKKLEVLLVLGDGTEVPVRVHAGSLADAGVTISFSSLGCYTVRLKCSNCTPQEEECCNWPIESCADCTRCSLSCYACLPR